MCVSLDPLTTLSIYYKLSFISNSALIQIYLHTHSLIEKDFAFNLTLNKINKKKEKKIFNYFSLSKPQLLSSTKVKPKQKQQKKKLD